jgi:sec-independent protein translocase protein TatA
MGRIGGGELLLILLIALLIFGPSKLADMGKGLGEGLKNFKKGISPENDTKKPPANPPTATAPKSAEPTPAVPPAAAPSDKDKGTPVAG